MILSKEQAKGFGVDFAVSVGEKKIKILQITDMQFIDSAQCRFVGRLRQDEMEAWAPDMLDAQCGNQIRALVAETRPDLIIITGDMVYGSFDDSGRSFNYFCDLMESFSIPWAPVFGNHDNESRMGVDKQCEIFESAKHCLFNRGEVTGNGNYSVGLVQNDKLVRVIYMIDSNGCDGAEDEKVERAQGIFKDQVEWIRASHKEVEKERIVPSFLAFHIPTEEFKEAEIAKGYGDGHTFYTIGVDKEAKDGDFGCRLEGLSTIHVEGFRKLLSDIHADGVFVGHYHAINTCITYEGIKYVYGLKTGQYDSHIPGQNGGTLIRLDGEDFEVTHVVALAHYAPFPTGGAMHKNYFVEVENK